MGSPVPFIIWSSVQGISPIFKDFLLPSASDIPCASLVLLPRYCPYRQLEAQERYGRTYKLTGGRLTIYNPLKERSAKKLLFEYGSLWNTFGEEHTSRD